MKKFFVEKNWHRLFELGITLKAFNAVFEIISGTLILFVSKHVFNNVLLRLARGELLEDPRDRFINFLTHSLQNISTHTKIFAALYILSHGLLSLFLVIQLYREKLWAYLVAIGFALLFITYQIYRIDRGHSIGLTIITIYDILFTILTWHEYKYRQSQITNI